MRSSGIEIWHKVSNGPQVLKKCGSMCQVLFPVLTEDGSIINVLCAEANAWCCLTWWGPVRLVVGIPCWNGVISFCGYILECQKHISSVLNSSTSSSWSSVRWSGVNILIFLSCGQISKWTQLSWPSSWSSSPAVTTCSVSAGCTQCFKMFLCNWQVFFPWHGMRSCMIEWGGLLRTVYSPCHWAIIPVLYSGNSWTHQQIYLVALGFLKEGGGHRYLSLRFDFKMWF